MKPLKVIITRSKWGRGLENSLDSKLHNSVTDLNCCLGFASLALGCDLESITNKDFPRRVSIPNPLSIFLKPNTENLIDEAYPIHGNTDETRLAAEINDCRVNNSIYTSSAYWHCVADYDIPNLEKPMTEEIREAALTILFKNAWNMDLVFED